MHEQPSYASNISEKIIGYEEFKKFFVELEYSKRYDFLKDIFAENNKKLSCAFYNSRDFTPSEQAFLLIQKLPADYINDNYSIIEDIFAEAEIEPLKKDNELILRKIITLCLVKKAGLRIGFLNSGRIIKNNLPVKIKIELSVLLVYLEPNGLTFGLDIRNYPHLIPAKMLLFENKPFEILSEFLTLNINLDSEVKKHVVERPLKKCLEKLLINQGAIKEFVENLEPLALYHWSYDKILEHIKSPTFKKYKIEKKILSYKNSMSLPSQKVFDKLFKWFGKIDLYKAMQIENNNKIFDLLGNNLIRDNLIYKALKEIENYKDTKIVSQYETSLQAPANIIITFIYYFKYYVMNIFNKKNIDCSLIQESGIELNYKPRDSSAIRVVYRSDEYLKGLDKDKCNNELKSVIESL